MINAVVAIGQTDWEAQFVSGLSHPMTGIQVQRRCIDAVDVLAVIKVLSCDVVIISDHTLRVDSEFVAEVLSQNVRLVALTTQEKYFEDIGIQETVQLDLNNPLSAISVLAALTRVDKPAIDIQDMPTGELIFVGGFGGGNGKTRLAAELALQFAKQNKHTLLIDGDTYGPAILQLFGLPPAASGLLEICRKIERKTNGEKFISTNATNLAANLDLIAGINKNSRWIDLRPAIVSQFWQLCRSEYQSVVVDGGPVIEVEPLLALEAGIPKRNLVANSALLASQEVILTCQAQPINVTKLIKGLIENSSLFENKSISIALLAAGNKKQTKDCLHALATHTECENIFVIEQNNELVNKALNQNSFVSAISYKDQLTHTYQEIAKEIFAKTNRIGTNNRLSRIFNRQPVLTGVR